MLTTMQTKTKTDGLRDILVALRPYFERVVMLARASCAPYEDDWDFVRNHEDPIIMRGFAEIVRHVLPTSLVLSGYDDAAETRCLIIEYRGEKLNLTLDGAVSP